MPHRRENVIFAVVLAVALALATSASAATFKVTRTDDPNPGACKGDDCSLREAVVAANSTGPADTIVLKSKTYNLSQPGDAEDEGETGDLDVSDNLTLKGKGASSTAIKPGWAPGEDQMIEVLAGGKLAASGLTLRDGDYGIYAASGIYVSGPAPPDSEAKLVLKSVNVKSMDSGYGVDNYGRATLKRVRFIGNNAGEGCCPAFYNESDSTVKMTDVVFAENEAGADTGAMYSEGDLATLKNVTFAGNKAGSVGGALITSGGDQTLVNVTFFGNESTGSGGALEVENVDSLLLNNVTFAENVADSDGSGDGDGGGFHVSVGPLTLQNTIVAGNEDASPSGTEHPDCSGTFTSAGYNLIGIDSGCTLASASGDTSGTAADPLDPMLSPFGQNGGFVPTVPLRQGSPAINRGSPANPGGNDPVACAAKDARGVKRPQGSRCDKGAYERKR